MRKRDSVEASTSSLPSHHHPPSLPLLTIPGSPRQLGSCQLAWCPERQSLLEWETLLQGCQPAPRVNFHSTTQVLRPEQGQWGYIVLPPLGNLGNTSRGQAANLFHPCTQSPGPRAFPGLQPPKKLKHIRDLFCPNWPGICAMWTFRTHHAAGSLDG